MVWRQRDAAGREEYSWRLASADQVGVRHGVKADIGADNRRDRRFRRCSLRRNI